MSAYPDSPDLTGPSSAALLARGRSLQAAGRFPEATQYLGAAVDRGRASGDAAFEAQALRWFAVVHQQQGESVAALDYANASHLAAVAAGRSDLAADALCTAGGIAFETGNPDAARRHYLQAGGLNGVSGALMVRIETNLGILATVAGQWDTADGHLQRALVGYDTAGDERGAGEVLHNLGMLCAARRQWVEAEAWYRRAAERASLSGDDRLAALCSLNQAAVCLATDRCDEAGRLVAHALTAFNRLNAVADKPDAFRIQGLVFQAKGLLTLAESRLRAAIHASMASGNPLCEAEAREALGALLAETERNGEAAEYRGQAQALFRRAGVIRPAA